jgi:GNAT superfamily N-acetyltransferase
MEVTTRPGNPQDADAAVRLFQAHLNWINVWFDHSEVFQRPGALTRIRAFFESFPTRVAEVDGVLIGFATCEEANPRIIDLRQLYVDDAYRGQGIGQRLAAELEDDLRTRGIDTIMSTVSAYYFPGKKLPETLFRRLDYDVIDIAPGAQLYIKHLNPADEGKKERKARRLRFSSRELFGGGST